MPDVRPPKRMQIKVYLVCQMLNLAQPGTPNMRIIAASLTRQAAQVVVDGMPGTHIEKVVAVK